MRHLLFYPPTAAVGGRRGFYCQLIALCPFRARQILWADGPHREPVVAVVAVTVVYARSEVEVAGVDAVRRDERTRPVDAPAAGTDELGTFAAAGGRQEDGVAVRAIYLLELR